MMKKWKECDSDDCRSRLFVLDDGSPDVQEAEALDRQTDFLSFVDRIIDHPLQRATMLAARIAREKDRKNLGFDIKEGLRCLTRIYAEYTIANQLAKIFPGPVENYTTNSNDYISFENWSDVKDHIQRLSFSQRTSSTRDTVIFLKTC